MKLKCIILFQSLLLFDFEIFYKCIVKQFCLWYCLISVSSSSTPVFPITSSLVDNYNFKKASFTLRYLRPSFVHIDIPQGLLSNNLEKYR
jgi:hypothetical protein